MLFNSLEFLVFFPSVTLLYYILPHKYRWFLLLVASCYFYMAFVPIYILILGFTIIIDYVAGIVIEGAQGKTRKLYLSISLISNVAVLAIFKYYNFINENLSFLVESIGYKNAIPYLTILLPIGLSFHTFQAMSYNIEVYRGNQKAEKHFGIYALYVMFYPQLVAGPIERPQNLLWQFKTPHFFNWENLYSGLRLVIWGLFKKVVVADRLGIYVDAVYDNYESYNYLNLIVATFFFAIQIYCDFSGYSDMAIGTAKTMGFDLMTNFNRPYFASNIRDFWKRWHISLSTWFKDYVYIPLGGSRVSMLLNYRNIAVIFLLSGIWHGANWTFVIWGALHASYMVLFALYDKQVSYKSNSIFYRILSSVFTFSLVSLAWVFFRATTFKDAIGILTKILTFDASFPFKLYVINPHNLLEFGITSTIISLLMVLILFLVESIISPKLNDLGKRPIHDIMFLSIIISLIVILGVFQKESFIYFQF